MEGARYRLAVDVGGTFTDLVILNQNTGRIQTLKVSSTPRDPSEAVLNGVRRARDELGLELAQVSQFTHATTVCSNVVLQGVGARTGLLVTEGFRDLLEIQRHKRYRLFDQAYQKIHPLVPRRLSFGIPERIDASGAVIKPLDEAALVQALRALAAEGIEALGICFLFSFKNAVHEKRAGEIAKDILPKCFITLSSDIYPQYREYERASTTVVNAYLGPRVSTYLEHMSDALDNVGVKVPLHMMQSNGGIISWTEATQMPCRIVESGPAAGVIAAAHFGKLAGRTNLISFDMGGTTAKAGLIENGEVRQSAGQELGAGINISRILQGGGYYVGAATIDLAEVGAGGGSIAWLDSGGVLKVGPQSAGADPGPIAYGLGGDRVTVTDANLLLGRVPAEYFLGGEIRLDLEKARRIVEVQLAKPLNITVEQACAAVIEVANASMLKMLRIVTVEKGCDPGDFSLVAFGGNGPVHGIELAGDLGIREVIVPPSPGLLSAQGLLVADIRYDFRQTRVERVIAGDIDEVERQFHALENRGKSALRRYGLAENDIAFQRSADMRYNRQAYEINVRLPDGALDASHQAAIAEAFHQTHERLYGRRDEAGTVEFVTLCVTAVGDSRRLEYQPLPQGDGSVAHALKSSRKVFFRDLGMTECPCYDRALLRAGDALSGPVLLEAVDSTTVVPPGWAVRCDPMGNLMITAEKAKAAKLPQHIVLDASRLEILSNALYAITEEIQLTLLRSAYSQVVKEAQDASCAIFTATGRIVVQPVVIPGHLGSMRFMLQEILNEFPAEAMRPGDVFMSNDPYRGGSHLPDIGVFRPIFYENRLIAFAGCMIHYTDVGGMVPGSNPVTATELYQEGLVIPPVKLSDAGHENKTLIDMFRANVRGPDIFMGDLRAQEGALRKGEQRLRDLLEHYGFDGVSHAMELLIETAEKKAREAIKAIPKGVYEFTDYMDHDGVDLSKPIKIQVRLEVLDDRLRFDFTGTDPQVKGPLNTPLSKVWSAIFYCVQCILPDDIPFNDGLTKVVEVYVPEGTLLNPRHPAPVNARSVTVNHVAGAVLGALALAVPERVGAQCCGQPTGISFGGVNPKTGSNFVFYESYCGGMGGSQTADGADGISTGSSNPMNIPVESIEIDYPIRMTRYELVPDSGGSGRFRGGLGLLREYEMLAEMATVNVRGDGAAFPPCGLYGGGNGSFSTSFLDREGGRMEKIPSKFGGRIKCGQRLRIMTPGGGGFGDPRQRDRAALIRDFLDGKISAEKIKQDYGVDIRGEAEKHLTP